jgi:hypothetical protein
MVMSLAGHGTKNDYAGEGELQFTRPTDEAQTRVAGQKSVVAVGS